VLWCLEVDVFWKVIRRQGIVEKERTLGFRDTQVSQPIGMLRLVLP
jgi:hypothetical protein